MAGARRLLLPLRRHDNPPLAFVGTVRIKRDGIVEAMDTEESFRHGIRVLQERKVLPPRG